MYKQKSQINFADLAARQRKLNDHALNKINKAINWAYIENEIDKVYTKGKRLDGRPAYSGLLLFKICLLEVWARPDGINIEDLLNDSIRFTYFIGLSMNDEIPSMSTIHRFKKLLIDENIYQALIEKVHNDLEAKHIRIRPGRHSDIKVKMINKK